MDVETQIADLDRRVSTLEKTAKGQDRHNSRVTELLTELKEDAALLRRHAISTGQKVEDIDSRLSAVEARLGAVETKMDKIETRLGKVEAGLEGVRADIAGLRRDLADVPGLRRDLPGIIAETMREVLREGK
jgi:chromosome segregation ATPase